MKLFAKASPPRSASSIQCTATHISPTSVRTSPSFFPPGLDPAAAAVTVTAPGPVPAPAPAPIPTAA
ncbi:hypothetical protein E4U51_007019, partial [Claviceps purpurea]